MLPEKEPSNHFRWHDPEFDDSNFQIRGRTLFFIVLFSIILLVTLMFLYARWICRAGLPPARASTSAAPQAPPQQRPRGLDVAAIEDFPIVLYRESERDVEGECSICLGVFLDGDKVKVLPECEHCFHPECVDKWLGNQASCPLCRASLRVESPV